MKTKQKIQNKNLVEITFDDPAEFDATRDTELLPVECKAVGWLEEQNSSLIRICWLREEDDAPYVGLAIPKGCVKKMRPLRYVKQQTNIRRRKN